MNFKRFFSAAVLALFVAAAANAQTTLVDLDCSSIEGFNIITKAPAGVKAVEKYGSVKISDEGKFQVELNSTDDYSLAKAKAEIKGNDVNKLKKYIVDEAAGIIYESEVMGKTQYHFMYFVASEEGGFYFQDVKGPNHDLKSIQTMYDAAKASKIVAEKEDEGEDDE